MRPLTSDLPHLNLPTYCSPAEPFDQLQEGRNKAGYCISLDGRRVAVYVRDQTWTDNLAIYDVDSQTYTVTLVCSGTLLDVQFRCAGGCGARRG